MNLGAAESKDNRVVYNFPVERPKIEDLQRWVNAGHDPWCRDSQLVAAASLERVLVEARGIELAALPVELERGRRSSAVYAYHSIDGRSAYRITLRRYRWLLPVAGSANHMIWIPERVEIVTHDAPTASQVSLRSAQS